MVNGLEVRYKEPSNIADDRNIRVVFFKENLSTGWDCPRAETMMSFKHASDATYIAQLLGRMVRTPMQMHIQVDDVLNDVHLYLPYFNESTVKDVVEALQSTEGGDIPTDIYGESLSGRHFETLTVRPKKKKEEQPVPGQMNLFDVFSGQTSDSQTASVPAETTGADSASEQPESAAVEQRSLPEATGTAKLKLNGWETELIEVEEKRPDFVCWIRNPSRGSWALCIPYEIDGEIKPTYPDFIVVRKDDRIGYVIDILEPHSPDFKDNLGKAKGFAEYARQNPGVGRIQLTRMSKDAVGKNQFKRLDMYRTAIRDKVSHAINTDELDHIFDTDGVIE